MQVKIVKCPDAEVSNPSKTGDGSFEMKISTSLANETAFVSCDTVDEAIARCGLSPEEEAHVIQNPVTYEAPEQTINISIDDVGAKKQKEHRDGPTV